MHRALQIPEILAEIIGHLPRSSLSRAARVSTEWMEPALNKLWETVDELEPLLKLLAPLSWDKMRNASFRSTPSPRSLARFRGFYAHRIRCMEIHDWRSYTSVWQAMKDSMPTPSLLPHLVSLVWEGPLEGTAIFWTPALHKLCLHYQPSSHPSLLRLLDQHLASGTPALLEHLSCTDISWRSGDMEPEARLTDVAVQASLASLIRASANLRHISLPSRYLSTPPFLTSVSFLCHLRKLNISTGDKSAFELLPDLPRHTLSVVGSIGFSSLSSVMVGTLRYRPLAILLPLFKNSPVENWEFYAGEVRQRTTDVEAALRLVCGRFRVCTLQMSSFRLDEVVKLSCLNPLYRCQSSLKHLSLSLSRGRTLGRAFQLSDQDIRCLAQDLPHLHSLELWTESSESFSKDTSDLTILSLVHLAHYCREIEDITLHWNASFTSFTDLPPITHRFGCLKTLAMRHLRIKDPKVIAWFLATICVKQVDTDVRQDRAGCQCGGPTRRTKKYDQRWRRMDAWYRLLCNWEGSAREREQLRLDSIHVWSDRLAAACRFLNRLLVFFVTMLAVLLFFFCGSTLRQA